MSGNPTRLRSDGRFEVADHSSANETFGCDRDGWCILTNGHNADCSDDREVWAGPDALYPPTTPSTVIR